MADNDQLVKPRKRGRPPKRKPEAFAPQTSSDAQEAVAPTPQEIPDASFDVLHDPWGEQDFMQIRQHPDGFVLRFVNPQYRARRGWRGWEPVTWSSEIGKNLGDYLIDPPHRFQGGNSIDDYIRVGSDLVLCKLPVAAYKARMKAKQDKRDKIMGSLGGAKLVQETSPDKQADYQEYGPRPVRGMPLPNRR